MALPKEPRQKMINIMYLVLTAILAINVSNEVIVAFKTVNASLEKSTLGLASVNDRMLSTLEKEKGEATSKAQAEIWAPRAQQAKNLSAALTTYLDGLKQKVKEGAGLEIKDGEEHFIDDNLNSSTNLFEKQGKGPELEKKLEDYKAQMLAIDPKITDEFKNSFPLDIAPPAKKGEVPDFTRTYFHMTPTVAALTVLSKFQNNVANSENKIVAFCQRQIGEVAVHMDQAAVLVSQSSNYLMPGDKLIIKAGVGAYSSTSNTTITINGSNVPVNAGVAQHILTVEGAGERNVSVHVQYHDEHNVLQNKEEIIKYTIGTPGAAAVMLDKMNVLYIGVDNPVTIGSPTGWDKTNVLMTGGTISGSNSSRTVRVTKVEDVNINVTANGKLSAFKFRVKRIPDPIFKIASGKPRMPSVEFKSQQYCRADLENFDFALKYNVVSATVYFSGAGFPSVRTASISGNSLSSLGALIHTCQPGSVVTFDNIKVSGPDGQRTIDGKSFALY